MRSPRIIGQTIDDVNKEAKIEKVKDQETSLMKQSKRIRPQNRHTDIPCTRYKVAV